MALGVIVALLFAMIGAFAAPLLSLAFVHSRASEVPVRLGQYAAIRLPSAPLFNGYYTQSLADSPGVPELKCANSQNLNDPLFVARMETLIPWRDDTTAWIANWASVLIAAALFIYVWTSLSSPARVPPPNRWKRLIRLFLVLVLAATLLQLFLSVSLTAMRTALVAWHNDTLSTSWQRYSGGIAMNRPYEFWIQDLAANFLFFLLLFLCCRRFVERERLLMRCPVPDPFCPRCGYPTMESDRCSECGTPNDGSHPHRLRLTRFGDSLAGRWAIRIAWLFLIAVVAAGLFAPLTHGLYHCARSRIGM